MRLHFQRLNSEHAVVQFPVQIESYFPNYIIFVKHSEHQMAKHTSRNSSQRKLWPNIGDEHLEIIEAGPLDIPLTAKLPMHGSRLQQHPSLYPLAPVSSQYPCSQRAPTTQLSWKPPFFRVGNGSAFAACVCLVRQSPCP